MMKNAVEQAIGIYYTANGLAETEELFLKAFLE